MRSEQPNPTQTPVNEPPPPNLANDGDESGESLQPRPPAPAMIGDTVFYMPRNRWTQAIERGQVPVPYAAIVARLNVNKENVYTGLATLLVIDPETGPELLRDVPQADDIQADHWTHRPQRHDVGFGMLQGLVQVAVQEEIPDLMEAIKRLVAEQVAGAPGAPEATGPGETPGR